MSKQSGHETQSSSEQVIWFVYDGACPICTRAAEMLKIRQSHGPLKILDARSNRSHSLLFEINQAGLDLDQGMVIKYQDKLYHGPAALRLMAQLAAPDNWFNRINSALFRAQWSSTIAYPFMRMARNLALRMKGEKQIRNLPPENPIQEESRR